MKKSNQTTFKVLKIRDKITGLYSTGTTRPKWSEYGKTWASKGHLKLHLGQFVDSNPDKYTTFYANAEIVEVEVTQSNEHVEDAIDIINSKYDEKIREYERHVERRPTDDFYNKYLLLYKANKALINGERSK